MSLTKTAKKYNRSAVSTSERLNTFLPDIVAQIKPDTPIKPQADGSVRVGNKGALVLGPQAGHWFDHEASVGGHTAQHLIKHLGVNAPRKFSRDFLADHKGHGSLAATPDDTTDSKLDSSRAAMEIFIQQSQPLQDTPAETYLQSRGISAPYPDNIRWVENARWGESAMLAVVNGTDGPTAAQLTYLTPDGQKSTVEPQRRTYIGQADWHEGGGFRLAVGDAPERTIIVEGAEDALSLAQAGAGTVIVASLGLSNLGKAPVDADLPVVVFRDGDDPDSPAEKGLAKGVDRLILQGATVTITDTPLGADANAILQSDGPDTLLELLESAELACLSVEGHVERCARLSHTEYEEIRTALAKELNIRVSFLDKQVSALRRDADQPEGPKGNLGIEEIEPWPEPVILSEVLNDIARALGDYIAADNSTLDTATLWAAHTHIVSMINVSPRLAAQAPGPGCGKTVTMEAIGNLVPRPLTAASITSAVVFRVIEDVQPTLLLDEADQMLADRSSPLIPVLNSSHRKSSAYVMRTEEVLPGQFVPVRFSTWAPVMFAGIRELPPTLQDRSIVLRLSRAKPGEVKKHLRDGKCDILAECGQKLARWADDQATLPDVELPPTLTNRIGDNWRPLLAIAKLAGSDWTARALEAAEAAVKHQDQGLISTLLKDIYEVFGEREQILSQELVDGLIDFDEKPYGELNRGRAITSHWLGNQLRGVITRPTQTMRVRGERKKGYWRAAFNDAWERYAIGDSVPQIPPKTTVSNVTTGQPLQSKGNGGTDAARLPADVTDGALDVTDASRLQNGVKPSPTVACHGVTDDTVGLEGISEASAGGVENIADEDGGDDTCLI
jgi:hypothetical protein